MKTQQKNFQLFVTLSKRRFYSLPITNDKHHMHFQEHDHELKLL